MLLVLSVNVCVCSVLLDELAAWLHIISHQHGEYLVCLGCILDGYLLEQACRWVHGGLPKLLWVHLTQTFVSLGVDILVFLSLAVFVEECLSLLLGVAVLAHLATISTFVERWCRDIQMALS